MSLCLCLGLSVYIYVALSFFFGLKSVSSSFSLGSFPKHHGSRGSEHMVSRIHLKSQSNAKRMNNLSPGWPCLGKFSRIPSSKLNLSNL